MAKRKPKPVPVARPPADPAVAMSLRLTPPEDYLLARDLCSYGYYLLEPNFWDVRTQRFRRVLDLGKRAVAVLISQPRAKPGASLNVHIDTKLTAPETAELQRQLIRMLRLDEPAETIAAFHAVDDRWAMGGRGRVSRSPTMFEDVIKTVTSCNVTWPSTVSMNRKLCFVAGRRSTSGLPAFPTAKKLASMRPATLRARCGVGYRDGRIVELAKLFVKGKIDVAWFENPATPDEDVRKALLDLPGIGPYAAANIMQLLGRFGHLPLDTESVRHGRTVLAMRGSGNSIMKRLHKHFAPFGEHRFRSYWFELWAFYESKRGPSHTWERETTGKSFTAAALK
ncbi:MAG: hypothetical protein ACREJO_07865 [Phycisphaerales bacterium]